MNRSNREYDVVVLGATGFTGQLVVEYLYSRYGMDSGLRWAIAGRNEAKLKQLCSTIAGANPAAIPLIVADSSDPESMANLVGRTRVVCTTVGPYARYGSALVEACAREGTHYCDLTGEVQWMRKMIDNYQTMAEDSGAIIVHTCGFDSIPSDLGVHFMQTEMQARFGVYATEVKCRIGDTRGGVSGGTVDSMMNLMEEMRDDAGLRDLLSDPYSLNPLNMPRGPDGPDTLGADYDQDFHEWTAPFLMAGINTRVVRRSNALLDYRYGKDFRYSESMLMGDGPLGYAKAAMVSGGTVLVGLTAAFSPSRALLRSFVPAPGEGPSRQTIENGYYTIDFFARHPDDASKNMKGRVTGDRDPGYGSTSKMLAESAVCLAKDSLERRGGLWTPSSAMGDQLLPRLIKDAGLTFTIVD